MALASGEMTSNLMLRSIREGNLAPVEVITASCGLSYSPRWLDGFALLCEALKYGHTPVAEYLIQAGSKLNHTVLDYGVPLHVAVRKNLPNIVHMLLEAGALVNARVTFYCSGTALHEAVVKGNAELVLLLLRYGADVNMATYLGKTALHLAVEKNHCDLVDLLLQHGTCVDAICERQRGRTALYFAVEKGLADMVKCLLKYGPDVNEKINHAAVVLAMYEDAEIFSCLREYGFLVIPGDEKNALFDAICSGTVTDLVDFKELILRDDERCTPLHVATKYERKDTVELMVRCGANVFAKDENGKSPVDYVLENGDLSMFEVLVTNRNDLGEALRRAVIKGDVKFIESLLRRGADVNQDHQGLKVLHLAIPKSIPDVLNILLDYGADMNSFAYFRSDCESYTPLLYSIRRRKPKACEILLSRGANVNARTSEGWSALQLAASQRSGAKYLLMLLKYGADVNAPTETALHSAAAAGCEKSVELLLEYGSDINISTPRQNNSPLDCARSGWIHNREGPSCDGQCLHVEAFHYLLRHLVKIKEAGLNVSDRNREYLKPEIFNKYCEKPIGTECAEEIERLKSEEIEGCSFTFYNMLAANVRRLVHISMYKAVREIIFSSDFEKKFPMYGTMIRNKFEIGRRRQELEDRSSRIFRSLYPFLSFDCVDIIHTYLFDSELLLFINACSTDKYIPS